MPCLLPRQVQGVTLRPKSKSSGSSLLSLHRAHNALSVDDASVPKGWKVQSQKLSVMVTDRLWVFLGIMRPGASLPVQA